MPVSTTLVGTNQFIMPIGNITVTALWSKIALEKNMDGTISRPVEELRTLMEENSDATVSIDMGVNFVSAPSDGRLYIRSGTENDTNPIYYYRGAVENNNVLFAGICWQIVRTTETGGIKLIYNGVSNDGKTCSSRGNSYIGTSAFISGDISPGYAGYMYGYGASYTGLRVYTNYTNKYFGNSVSYSGGKYTLISTTKGGPTTGYHYTCNKTSAKGTCSTVYYVYAGSDMSSSGIKYQFELSGGETFETAMSRIHHNTHDSNVKAKIDNWYKEAIDDKGYTKYLDENSVWCSDREIVSGGLLSEGGDFLTTYMALYNRRTEPAVKNGVACSNVRD